MSDLKVLFFSRGRGHGHAIPDMEIASELTLLAPSIKIRFVSYGTGANTFRNAGHEIRDIGLPENNQFLHTLMVAAQTIADEKPHVVLAHEEFAAIASAKLLKLPAIFLSAWLPGATTVANEAIMFSDSVLLLDNPGVFLPPADYKGRVHFSGPVIRKMKYSADDCAKARAELGVQEGVFRILVVQGGWANEEKCPMAALVMSAFDLLPHDRKQLVWLAGGDQAAILAQASGNPHVSVLGFAENMDQLIVASDLVLTKGTRGITQECAYLRVPSISLSFGTNAIDDVLVPRIKSNLALNVRATNAEILAGYMAKTVRPPSTPEDGVISGASTGAVRAAKILHQEIVRLCGDPAAK